MIKKECFDICGMFNETLLASQDWDMWLRISEKYEVNYISEPLVRVYLHKNERISTNPNKKISGLVQIFELNKEYIVSHPHVYYLKKKELIPYYISADNIIQGWKILFEILKLEPYNIRSNITSFFIATWGTYKKIKLRIRTLYNKN